MPPKTVEEQLAELEMMGAEEAAAPPPKSSKASSKAARPASKPAAAKKDDLDALKELEELEALEKFQRPEATKPISRPNTPKISSSATSSTPAASAAGVPRRAGIATPSSSSPSTRTSEEKTAAPPAVAAQYEPPPPPEPKPAAGGGSWWGGILSTATATADAARKRAEAAYAEIQKNEEAQRWAEQVRGNLNVETLRGIGGELQKRALPTFSNILETIAPPISQHERLQIHITHDLIGYPSLDPIIYQTFSQVMSQVEGGDLLVIQRGSESTHRRPSVDGYRGGGSGWNDGPWWRHADKRDLSVVKGLVEGTKLARVSAEAYSHDFFAARGGVDEATKHAIEAASESNPVRSSDIFLSLQAISYTAPSDLFAGSQTAEDKDKAAEGGSGGVEEPKEDADDLVVFAIYLHDPIHAISYNALSQSFPAKWIAWLDAPAPTEAAGEDAQPLPAEIEHIVRDGGVDPREWVAEWVEETIGLGVGIVAQRYVARRMGVGEGGLGRGKAREAVIEAGGGEAARAGII